jgi:hypothetical protein
MARSLARGLLTGENSNKRAARRKQRDISVRTGCAASQHRPPAASSCACVPSSTTPAVGIEGTRPSQTCGIQPRSSRNSGSCQGRSRACALKDALGHARPNFVTCAVLRGKKNAVTVTEHQQLECVHEGLPSSSFTYYRRQTHKSCRRWQPW